MDLKDVIYEKDGHIATITLNRPDRLNALGGSLSQDLDQALREAERDGDVRCVILTGAGRAFCAGLDMKDRAAGERTRTWPQRLNGLNTPKLVLGMKTPIIAAVNGPAVGWGFEVAMLCDYRIGSEDARMGDIHVKRGLVQDCASILTVPRLIGWAAASRIFLTGELLNAQECLKLGVLNEVVPGAELTGAAQSFAGRIACNAPLAVQMTKRLMRMANPMDVDGVVDYSLLLMGALQETDDFREGVDSFLEKREAEFHGR